MAGIRIAPMTAQLLKKYATAGADVKVWQGGTHPHVSITVRDVDGNMHTWEGAVPSSSSDSQRGHKNLKNEWEKYFSSCGIDDVKAVIDNGRKKVW